MGLMRGLDAEAYDRTYRDRDLLVRMLVYFKPHRGKLLLALAAIAVISVSQAGSLLVVSQGLDALAQRSDPHLITLLTITLFIIGFLTWGANWVRRRLITISVAHVMLALRTDAFTASVGHDLAFFDEFSSGKVVSRITNDTQDFAEVLVLTTDLFTQLVQAFTLFIALIRIDFGLTLWIIGTLPFVFLFALSFRRIARRVTRRGFRAMANVNAAIKEAVTGIAVAKNFRQEAFIYDEFDEINRQSYAANIKRGLVLALVFPSLNALSGLGTALLVYVGGLSAAAGTITAGAWYLFLTSMSRFWFPVLNLSSFWTQIQNGLSAAERVFALIDAESNMAQIDTRLPPRLTGDIQFQKLDFYYKPNEPVLSKFDLHIRSGESLALVGHTGAGKSTIARLIARYYEFQGGKLLIDGHNIRTFDLEAYRQQLGIVSQTPFLFSGTVVENIRYARPEATREEIASLSRQIGEGEWLASLPDGLDSEVGERGNRLSMGQRQLVALLRVLVQKPAIFILDEATASVDPFTEAQIQQTLEMILAGSTSILIAHRLSTVRAADRIIVLRQGEIIEEGNHADLMALKGHYAELYNTYFRHQSLEYVEKARQNALKS
ncbi:MAG: ABC transporter ATP-binding protein [Anaerolineales bacterium]|jgi:ATP-binding cassette subfamily B protein